MKKEAIPSQGDLTHLVADDEAEMRVDRWFKRHFPGAPHAFLQKWLRTGQVRINGRRVQASDRLVAGQQIRVPPQLTKGDFQGAFSASASDRSQGKPIRNVAQLKQWVLYEDDDVVVLNKPSGLAVQGGTGLKENLDDSLMAFSLDGRERPRLVHRLDRATSGVLLIARNAFAAAKLAQAFRDRATRKIYWAVTLGIPKPLRGEVDIPLARRGEKVEPAIAARDKEAKSAVTLYRVVEQVSGKAAFVEAWPVTGRTHQIRAHLAFLGTPIWGDPIYGGNDATDDVQGGEGGAVGQALANLRLGKGLHLHARRLVIPHPRGRGMIDVTAPLNKEMRKTWERLGFSESPEAWEPLGVSVGKAKRRLKPLKG